MIDYEGLQVEEFVFDTDEDEPNATSKHLDNHASSETRKPSNSNREIQTKKIYSQRLGKWIDNHTCMICGQEGHHAGSVLCPLRRNEPRQRHWIGKLTCTQRATRFIKWILEHFDEQQLKATGILDIAGGQGHTAVELQLSHSRIPCTVIDPRQMTFSIKQQRYFKYQIEHPQEYPTTPIWPNQKQMLFLDDFFENSDNVNLWNSVSLVVGMHPDEATERIVQFALKYNKNFAVLPCCVFPNQFPNRFTKDGRHVRYYEEFCDYLQELDPTIQRETLNIPGRNFILWKKFN